MKKVFDLTKIPDTRPMVAALIELCDNAAKTGRVEYLPGSSFILERRNVRRKENR